MLNKATSIDPKKRSSMLAVTEESSVMGSYF